MSAIDIWRIRLGHASGALHAFWACLDEFERERANRFRRTQDRDRFVVARGTLRRLLGERLGADPGALAFGANAWGKPHLEGETAPLAFNTSHSGDWIAHAISGATPVGLDVEAIRDDMANLNEFRQVLAPGELHRLEALAPADRAQALADIWVRKEAYVKALGEGVSRTMSGIEIGPLRDGTFGLIADASASDADPVGTWAFVPLDFGADYAGCLAYAGTPRPVHLRDFEVPA
jgi:4'-phosphopantetheinyl transferase